METNPGVWLSSLSVRVVVSVLLVLLGSLLSLRTVPRAVDTISAWFDRTLERAGIRDLVYGLWRYPPLFFTRKVSVFAGRVLVLTPVVLTLLLVWGHLQYARRMLLLLVGSIPDLAQVTLTGVILGFLYAGTLYIDSVLDDLSDGMRAQEHSIVILTRSCQLIFLLGGVLTLLSIWDVHIANLLIGAGLLGIVVGFAAQETLSSVIAGFVLMFSRPFEVGDWIEVEDEEGWVTDVTIVNTRIRTPDAQHVIIPNDSISQSTIVNLSQENQLRLSLRVGVDYGTDLERVERIVETALEDVERISGGAPTEVHVTEFGDSSIEVEIRFWVDNPTPQVRKQARSAALQRIQEAFEKAGIDIPFPQRRIDFPDDAAPIQSGNARLD